MRCRVRGRSRLPRWPARPSRPGFHQNRHFLCASIVVNNRAMTTTSKTTVARTRVLADGNQIPLLGLGVWQVPNGPECENAVRWGLELGSPHIDTPAADGHQ